MKYLAIALTLLVGCAAYVKPPLAARPIKPPRVDTVVWVEEMQPFAVAWAAEVGRRYPDAVVILCHGDDRRGEWVFVPDEPWAVESVTKAIGRLRSLPWIGDRRIVLVTCNPGGYGLPPTCGLVSYCAAGSVRFGTDRYILSYDGWKPDAIHRTGNVFEFTEVVPNQ